MKFQLAVLVATSSALIATYAPSVYAAECTAAQQTAANVLGGNDADYTAFEKACAHVLDQDHDGSASFDPSAFASLNASSLAALSGCKQPACAAYLEKQIAKVPDCELATVNVRVVYKSIVDFCSNASTTNNSSDDGSLDDGAAGTPFFVTVEDQNSTSSGSSAGQVPSTTAPTVGDDNAKATDAKTKSAAGSGAYASATAVITATLLSLFVCM